MKIYPNDYRNIRDSVFANIIDDTLESIRKYLLPEQVFDDSTLAEWAESTGYKKVQAVEDTQDKDGGACDDANLL